MKHLNKLITILVFKKMEKKSKYSELGKIIFFANIGKLLLCVIGSIICSFFVRIFLFDSKLEQAFSMIPFSFLYNLIFWSVCITAFKFLGGWTRKKDLLEE